MLIIAKTDMKEMPEKCTDCDLFIRSALRQLKTCAVTGVGYWDSNKGRPYGCPLKKVDEAKGVNDEN